MTTTTMIGEQQEEQYGGGQLDDRLDSRRPMEAASFMMPPPGRARRPLCSAPARPAGATERPRGRRPAQFKSGPIWSRITTTSSSPLGRRAGTARAPVLNPDENGAGGNPQPCQRQDDVPVDARPAGAEHAGRFLELDGDRAERRGDRRAASGIVVWTSPASRRSGEQQRKRALLSCDEAGRQTSGPRIAIHPKLCTSGLATIGSMTQSTRRAAPRRSRGSWSAMGNEIAVVMIAHRNASQIVSATSLRYRPSRRAT